VHEAPWILNSALLSVIEALLLHGETCPVTGLPARATSAASDFLKEDKRWGIGRIAVSGQTPNSMEGLCLRCPHSFFLRVHGQDTTDEAPDTEERQKGGHGILLAA
jgi:hypothetical protein